MQVDEKRWLLFDVTMGAYDGTEVCELVETFSIGLYHDNGLSVFKNPT